MGEIHNQYTRLSDLTTIPVVTSLRPLVKSDKDVLPDISLVKIHLRRHDVLLPVILGPHGLLCAHHVLLLDLRGQDQPQHLRRHDVLLPVLLGPHVLLRSPSVLFPVIVGPGEVIPAT